MDQEIQDNQVPGKFCKKICVKFALGTIVNRHYNKIDEWDEKENFLKDFKRDYECLKFKCIGNDLHNSL